MKNDHWFKFYYKLILISCQGWKDDEFGAYVRLLINQFDRGGLPDDPIQLSKLMTSYKKNWPLISKKFKKGEDGLLRNNFMSEVREERDLKVKKNTELGKLGGLAKASKNNSERLPNAKKNSSHIKRESKKGDIERDQKSGPLAESNLFRKPKIPTKHEVMEVFTREGGSKEMAASFWKKHEATGWYLSGSPIVNFSVLASKFITNWNKNEEKKSPGEISNSAPLKQPENVH